MPSLSMIALLGLSRKQAVHQSKNPRLWLDKRLLKILVGGENSVNEYLEILDCMEEMFKYKGKGRKSECTPKELCEWLGIEFGEEKSVLEVMKKYLKVLISTQNMTKSA